MFNQPNQRFGSLASRQRSIYFASSILAAALLFPACSPQKPATNSVSVTVATTPSDSTSAVSNTRVARRGHSSGQSTKGRSISLPPNSIPDASRIRIVRRGLGVICDNYGRTSPTSYLVYDIGKPGIPKISKTNLIMLHQMMEYVHPSTLRFAYVGGRFIVFDARSGACSGTQYAVLNAKWCNEIYVPADADNKIFAGPGGCFTQPRPWIPHDIGNPGGMPWKDYPNSH